MSQRALSLGAATAVVAILGLAGSALAQPAEFNLTVTPKNGTQQDSYVAVVQLEVPGVGGPDRYWPPRFDGFRVLDQQSSQTTSMAFDPQSGQQLRWVEIKRYVLQAKRSGRLVIGPAKVRMRGKDYETRSAVITVRAAGGGGIPRGNVDLDGADVNIPGFRPPRPRDAPLFLHAVVDQRQVYEGQQVVATWLLYSRSDVLGFEPRTPALADFWWESLYAPDKRLSYQDASVGGVPYLRSIVAKRALFPTRAGKVSVPSYEARVSSIETPGAKAINVRSREIELQVRPLPEGAPPGFDPTYVGVFDVEASVDRNRIDGGDALTFTVTIRGEGAIRRLSAPVIAARGFEVTGPRDDEPRVDVAADTVRGERVFRYLLRPLEAGALEVPAVTIPYFDPGRGEYVTATTSPLTVVVASEPGAGGSNPAALGQNLIGRDIRPSRATGELTTRTAPFLHERLWYWLLVLAPLVAYLAIIGVERVRERLSAETPRSRIRRARAKARQRLKVAEIHLRGNRPAQFFGELATALYSHLNEIAREPVQSLTREQLGEVLAARGFPTVVVERLQRELEAFDFARFAPSAAGPGEMRAAMRRVRELLRQIEKVRVDELAGKGKAA